MGEIRHIAKTGNMKSDVDVVDVRILQGIETIEEIYEEMGREKTKTSQKEYANEERTLLRQNLCCALPCKSSPLTGKKIFIAGKGKKSKAGTSSMMTILCWKSLMHEKLV